MNRASANRTISKQECMVLLRNLDLMTCTESIETVSLSGQYRLQDYASCTILQRYKRRRDDQMHLSLDAFFHDVKNGGRRRNQKTIIPHYVGGNSQPVYPPTENYARATLMIHKPWTPENDCISSSDDIIRDFENFMKSPGCPQSVRIPYERVRYRYLENRLGNEVISQKMKTSGTKDIDQDIADLLEIASTFNAAAGVEAAFSAYNFDTGINYDWSKGAPEVRLTNDMINSRMFYQWWYNVLIFMHCLFVSVMQWDPDLNGTYWLELECGEYSSRSKIELTYPMKTDGSRYELDDLMNDQRDVVAYILSKLREWFDYVENWDEAKGAFKPLRMTIVGAAGTGKTVLVNTIVTILRDIFGINDVVQLAAPTGCAAFNIGGETMHHLFMIAVRRALAGMELDLSEMKKKILKNTFRRTIAILLDERSMVALKAMGVAASNTAATAHGGFHEQESFGGIPILILFGDDYQLPPPIAKGPFDILINASSRHNLAASEILGAEVFLSCAEDVMVLTKSKRAMNDQVLFRAMLEESRTSDITQETADVIVNELLLNKFSTPEIKELTKDALFISANKEPVSEFNLRRLKEISGHNNPVAIIRSSTLKGSGRGISSHFNGMNIPATTPLCIGAMVSLNGRNFNPKWGLFNGAIGYVIAIVYEHGKSPNDGDLPLYVAVRFPGYCGPAWYPEHPKV